MGVKEVSGVALVVAQEAPASSSMAVAHGPAGVRRARHRLRDELHERGLADSVIDDAVLILSELLSNACRHGRPLPAAAGPRVAESTTAGQDRVDTPDRVDSSGGAGTSGGTDPSGGAGTSGGTVSSGAARASAQAPDPAPAPLPDSAPDPDPDSDGDVLAAWEVDRRGRLTVEVTDGGGPTRPVAAKPSVTARGGRGLSIITALSENWGVRDEAHGEVTVWAVLGHGHRGEDFATRITGPALPLTGLEGLEGLDELEGLGFSGGPRAFEGLD